ncbi:MAG TPA: ribokinase [Planosporangium sp.]|jgi:ribokinase|nr:ribokinase [Planosporangium sp.]
MSGPRVAVLGSANMDLVVNAGRLPEPGETVLGRDFTTVPGGKGANQAVAVARAGGDCAFIGAVGTDQFGAQLRERLRSAGVDASRLRMVDGPSGVALIAVDDAGENMIVVAPGANGTVTGLSAADEALIVAADALMCQLEVPVEAVAAAARVARAGGVRVVLNAAPARPLPVELTGAVDLLLVNQVEARTVAGVSADVDGLLDALVESVPRVVLTLGPGGVAYADADGVRLRVPAPVVSTLDSTAAGDAFAGAFVVAWSQGRPLGEALRWACAAGAACARRRGASSSLPARDEIDDLFRAAYPTVD